MLIAVAIVAFTMGLVLEPVLARSVRTFTNHLHNRKAGKTFLLLEQDALDIHVRNTFNNKRVLEPEDAWL